MAGWTDLSEVESREREVDDFSSVCDAVRPSFSPVGAMASITSDRREAAAFQYSGTIYVRC